LSLDGLLTVIGIIIAIYALAQPIQRLSVHIFVPIWLIILLICSSAIILIWRYAIPTLHYKFLPRSDLASIICAFFLPVIGAIIAVIFWYIAKLKSRKDGKFRELILTCLYEDKFSELVRILNKNKESLAGILKPETLELLFERKFVRHMVSARNWIHLDLFSNRELIKKLTDRFRITNNIMREFVTAYTSPLHSAIVSKYGGREHARITEEEGKLVDKTLQEPEWYMSVRADYPLIVFAVEELASGKFDISYNQKNENYSARQGESTRLSCPVYLALKTHVLMLEKAIEIEGEDDYYVSDFFDLFRNVYEHSEYDKNVWENIDARLESPTPFVYLMREILYDFENLCNEDFNQGKRPPSQIGSILITMWSLSLSIFTHTYKKCKVSDKFKFEYIGEYLSYAMKMMERYEEATGERKKNIKLWRDQLVKEVKSHRIGFGDNREMLTQSMDKLDIGKRHIFIYREWLRGELGLTIEASGSQRS